MITLDAVTKRYGAFTALDNVTFTADQGRITGFLGPNGAGKTTSMRVLVGLTGQHRGEARIGRHRYVDIPNPGRHVGVLLDASAQHGGRTGREILALGAATMGVATPRVDELLQKVGLSPQDARRRLRHYSWGMRQRLGIAHALLGDPSVLILDEPANGLDPAGIHWMRSLLREHAARGGTVLLSSHLLHEVELIADDIVLIGAGRIVAHGPKDDLLRASGTWVRAVEGQQLWEALRSEGLAAVPDADGFRVEAEPVEVGGVAAKHGLVLAELRPASGAGLEALYLQLTRESPEVHATWEHER